MVYDKCEAYNPIIETQRVEIGSSGGEPIYCEKNVIITEYCSLYKGDVFNCIRCPVYIADVNSGRAISKNKEKED